MCSVQAVRSFRPVHNRRRLMGGAAEAISECRAPPPHTHTETSSRHAEHTTQSPEQQGSPRHTQSQTCEITRTAHSKPQQRLQATACSPCTQSRNDGNSSDSKPTTVVATATKVHAPHSTHAHGRRKRGAQNKAEQRTTLRRLQRRTRRGTSKSSHRASAALRDGRHRH